MRINFVLPPSKRIAGGPLAILEYANRLHDLGHDVSITTYSDLYWDGDSPFPWFNLKCKLLFISKRSSSGFIISSLHKLRSLFINFNIPLYFKNFYKYLIRLSDSNNLLSNTRNSNEFLDLLSDKLRIWSDIVQAIPECDLNIGTAWDTIYPVFMSRKGKPVFFMQHYEEVFYEIDASEVLNRTLARASYDLPVYKVANSSWLQSVLFKEHSVKVPFSNNAIVNSDFSPSSKKSILDGKIRIVTYSRPEDWKGFGDAVNAMSLIDLSNVEWLVFGYLNPKYPPNNSLASYTYCPKLSFKELSNLYATSDIALCPSWYESFPLPPLEAMASGTAVITTRIGTEDYAFDNINSLVVEAKNIDQMHKALITLISDHELRQRLASEGLKTSQKYNWNDAVENREKILKDIFAGKYDDTINSSVMSRF